MQAQLVDIDELILLCRDDEARKYIREAVGSYKIGAFRACIVMVWVAIVYDFLYKLRELQLAGDKQAASKLAEFETARTSRVYEKSEEFEQSVLKSACEDFEFIDHIQLEELERLKRDRNRCAHPSMISQDEIYEPSAEQARYHLRNAVIYMLQHHAAQGKSFVENLKKETESLSFPQDEEQAIKLYQSKQIQKAKAVVIRNLAIAFVKGLFRDDFSDAQLLRTSAALRALRFLIREKTCEAIQEHFPKQIDILSTSGQNCYKALRFMNLVDDTYQYLPEHCHIFITNSIRNETNPQILIKMLISSLEVRELYPTTVERISKERNVSALVGYFRKNTDPKLKEMALSFYEDSSNFREGDILAYNVIIPLIKLGCINDTDVERLFVACEKTNSQIATNSFNGVIVAIKDQAIMPDDKLKELLSRYAWTDSRYSKLIFP